MNTAILKRIDKLESQVKELADLVTDFVNQLIKLSEIVTDEPTSKGKGNLKTENEKSKSTNKAKTEK